MITYSIDAYSKTTENLIFEVPISKDKFTDIVQIMGLSEEDKIEFSHGIGVFNIDKQQAKMLEALLGLTFYSDDLALQLSGGESEE